MRTESPSTTPAQAGQYLCNPTPPLHQGPGVPSKGHQVCSLAASFAAAGEPARNLMCADGSALAGDRLQS